MRIERQWIRTILIVFATIITLAIFFIVITFGVMQLTNKENTDIKDKMTVADKVEEIINEGYEGSIIKSLYDEDKYNEYKSSLDVIEVNNENIINIEGNQEFENNYIESLNDEGSIISMAEVNEISITNSIMLIDSKIINEGKIDLNITNSIVFVPNIYEKSNLTIYNSIIFTNDIELSGIKINSIIEESLVVVTNLCEKSLITDQFSRGEEIGIHSYIDMY